MDITLDAGELYFGLNAAMNLEEELLNLSNAINGVSVSSELPSATIFSNLKTALISTINNDVDDLITRLENSKRILREYDEEAAMLFTFFDNGIINGDFEFTEMPLLDQTDYTNIKYSQGTVATSGCGITSVCMVASYFTGNLYTPEDLAAMANKAGSNNVDRMTWAADYVGLKWYCNENTSTTDLKNLLSEGKVVICLVKNSSHFVVCKGITEDGMILVNDPYGPWAKDEPYSLNDLKMSCGKTWVFDPAENQHLDMEMDTNVSVEADVVSILQDENGFVGRESSQGEGGMVEELDISTSETSSAEVTTSTMTSTNAESASSNTSANTTTNTNTESTSSNTSTNSTTNTNTESTSSNTSTNTTTSTNTESTSSNTSTNSTTNTNTESTSSNTSTNSTTNTNTESTSSNASTNTTTSTNTDSTSSNTSTNSTTNTNTESTSSNTSTNSTTNTNTESTSSNTSTNSTTNTNTESTSSNTSTNTTTNTNTESTSSNTNTNTITSTNVESTLSDERANSSVNVGDESVNVPVGTNSSVNSSVTVETPTTSVTQSENSSVQTPEIEVLDEEGTSFDDLSNSELTDNGSSYYDNSSDYTMTGDETVDDSIGESTVITTTTAPKNNKDLSKYVVPGIAGAVVAGAAVTYGALKKKDNKKDNRVDDEEYEEELDEYSEVETF